MNNSHQANGKSTHVNVPMFSTIEPRPEREISTRSFTKVLSLVQAAVVLELQLKTTMADLDREMKALGQGELPAVLVSLAQSTAHAPQAQRATAHPTLTKAQPR